MKGAAHMAAFAALRGGAGLVHAALPQGAGAQKPFPEVITVDGARRRTASSAWRAAPPCSSRPSR